MIKLKNNFRYLVGVLLPTISILIAIICGLTFWCVASHQGTCFVIKLIAGKFNGSATNIQGTIVNGLRIGSLSISNKSMSCNINDLYLHIKWESLLKGVLRASQLSIHSTVLNLKSNEENLSKNNIINFKFPKFLKVDLFSIDSTAIYNENDEFIVSAHDLLARINTEKNSSGIVLERLDLCSLHFNASVSGLFKITLSDNLFSACADILLKKNPSSCKILRPEFMNCSLNIRANGDSDRVCFDIKASNKDFIIENSTVFSICNKLSLLSCFLDINSHSSAGRAFFSISRKNKEFCDFFSLDCNIEDLDFGLIFNNNVPSLLLNLVANANFEILEKDYYRLILDAKILDNSKWNDKELSGIFKTDMNFTNKDNYSNDNKFIDYLSKVFVRSMDLNLSINNNKFFVSNVFNETQHCLAINAVMPNLSDLCSKLSGSINLDIDMNGLLKNHSIRFNTLLDKVKIGNFARWKNVSLSSYFSILFNHDSNRLLIFRLHDINTSFDDLLISLNKNSDINLSLDVDFSNLTWRLGKFCMIFKSHKHGEVVLEHILSSGSSSNLETKAKFKNLLSDSLIFSDIAKLLGMKFNLPYLSKDLLGIPSAFPMYGEWDISFSDNLQGYIEINAYDKFLLDSISNSAPIFNVLLKAKPRANRYSDISLDVKLKDSSIGFMDAKASLVSCINNNLINFVINKDCFIDINMDINDLSIVNKLLRDDLEIGGSLNSIINFIGSEDGRWNTNGSISIEKFRLFMLDKGIYLDNGCLLSHSEGRKFIVDKLNFPSTNSIKNKETYDSNSILHNRNIKDGYILCNGYLDLEDLNGKFFSIIQKFPVLQRSDCYASVSGNIDIDIAFPTFFLSGKLTADNGLVNLDHMLRASTLDDDVIVQHFGILKNQSNNSFLLPNIDLLFDLGDKFRISVLGLNTGLFGSIRTSSKDDGRLVGIGTLKANDGIVDAYGKRLKVKHGSLTFQGRLDNPLIDVEALKSGELIESGIRVSGTLQKPVVTLVSYPDVSDVEKLSWLILGRGPEDNASDISLLYSVGTALLGRGQSLYRQLGLSDVSIKNGSVGSFDSLLPGQTVVGSLVRDEYDRLSTQFVVASKKFSNGVDLSIEQSLASTETVGRISYRLSHSWSFDIKIGSVNGAAFICRSFFE
ncbi:translocation/assembly module TamB domain-containing protein [Candidatus Kinetoplastidibacterium galati]|uniref:Translocation and assembly module TamB C-terminal domain-containing protein n=1 Tax=Candidatus Kinetoplastidibacterium galati TCC219 TaxID=1208921 RepID=M1MA82_9PROT|nr:translocation/assembly module TamB domain-containing protein [Candidatus Kinetoplastibacterium galatii]AGF48810.1 conserved hypothetical protein of the DUF490 family [Candidatus Kinetoplastibacterium galatii TCC219]